MTTPSPAEIARIFKAAARVYRGKAGACCCGCKGTYVESNNLAGIERRAKEAAAAATGADEIDVGNGYIAVVAGPKIWIAYAE